MGTSGTILAATEAETPRWRPPVPNRNALIGILFVLRTGIPWEYLPKELGAGCGMTCWCRLRDWQVAGVWEKVWHAPLDELGQADAID